MADSKAQKRDRKATESRIMKAVGTVLVRDGFSALNIKSVAREAGFDKVLLYRYFGKIDDLLAAFAASAEFWPTVDEVVPAEPQRHAPAERLAYFLDRTTDALRSRPLTLELLAMEIGAPNPLTAALDEAREDWGGEVARRLADGEPAPSPHLNVAVSLILAGIQVLLVRGRTTGVYSGMDIGTETGWADIRASIPWICERLAAPAPEAASEARQ